MTSANKKYKDSVFRKYFSDEKKLRSLYSALTDTPCDKIKQIDIKTLENIMFGDVKNDLAFVVNHMVIVISEHMGSFSYNLPTRMLRYYTSLLDTIIEVKKLFSRSLVKIPAPEFYILYNGVEKQPKERTMKLSDAFLGTPDKGCTLELKVKLININLDSNHELLEKCPYIKEYSLFIAKVREYIDGGMALEEAMKNAIEYCKSHGIMVDFLQEHEMEVQKMKLGITLEELEEIRKEEAYEDGRRDGIKEGIREGVLETARNFKKLGFSTDSIAKGTGLMLEEIEKL